MVKVIKKNENRTTECWNCGSILEYEVEDIFQKRVFMCEWISYMADYIVCPECGSNVNLK